MAHAISILTIFSFLFRQFPFQITVAVPFSCSSPTVVPYSSSYLHGTISTAAWIFLFISASESTHPPSSAPASAALKPNEQSTSLWVAAGNAGRGWESWENFI